MSVFFIRVWVDGDSIVAVRTGEGLIQSTGNYGNATFIDAVAEGAYVDAGTLRPTLTYANNVLSSSLVTLLPAKDVTALLAQSGYDGQAVYNWSDGNQYQWNGAAWGATPLTSQAVGAIANQSFVDNIADAIIPYDNFADDAKTLIEGIQDEIQDYLNGYDGDVQSLTLADMTSLSTDIAGTYASTATLTSNYYTIAGADTAISSAITSFESTFIDDNDLATNAAISTAYYTKAQTDTVVASEITSLSASIAGTYATISTVASIEGDVDGIEAKYGVTIDSNGNVTGFQLLSGSGGSAFNVRADQFAVFNSTGGGGDNPFTVFTSSRTIGGVTYPAGVYIEDAYIDNAAIVDLSVGTLKIGNNAATVSDFDQYNPTLNSGNFISGAGMSTPLNACFAGVFIPANVTADIFLSANFRHGYLSTPTQWGFRIQRAIGASVTSLTTRTGMTATADFPVVTYLTTYSPGSSGATLYIDVDWYGQNSNIELQDATLSLVARYK